MTHIMSILSFDIWPILYFGINPFLTFISSDYFGLKTFCILLNSKSTHFKHLAFHLPTKIALVNVDKEVIFLLVGPHIDEPNPTDVAPAIFESKQVLFPSSSPLFALGHVVRLPHVKVTHLFSRVSSRALWAGEACWENKALKFEIQ